MLIFLIILIAVICSGTVAAKKNEFISDYCSPKNTATINAIFSVIIFLRHAAGYMELSGALTAPYKEFDAFMGQLIVVTYLFFSGYGIMESYKRKGRPYIKSMPTQRLFKTWYHFAIAIVMYAVVFLGVMQREMTGVQVLLAFTGYDTLGNSNWYMFVTFMLYVIVFVSFIWFKKAKYIPVGITCILTLVFALAMQYVDKNDPFYNLFAPHWYNTVLCFPLGMVFSAVKPVVDKLVMKNDITWITAFSAIFIVFAYFSQNRKESVTYYSLFAMSFAVLVVVFMMKINIKSTILDWFGEHIFSFFILQRIPMLLLREHGLNKNYVFFMVVSFFGTVFLSVVFDEVVAKLDSLIFKKRKKINA